MPIVQIQRVRGDTVVYAENFEVQTTREYEESLRDVECGLAEGEFSRTVSEGAPLYVDRYAPPEVRQ